MRLSPPSQYEVATQIVNYLLVTTIGYGVVASRVGAAGYPEAAIVVIVETGQTDCTAKVAVYNDRIVYKSRTGTYVSYPIQQEYAGRLVYAFLSLERD